ncbi:hypothetical protein V6N11_054590 [Hibiscus sabdariffa]|uniref:Uncharacterized protein n=1 Tax=Hibiscus sabdariffa TaxID=183260 RepID=A0ABR2S4C9_9ROSI
MPGVENVWKAGCSSHSLCGVSPTVNTTEVGGNVQDLTDRLPGCTSHLEAAGNASLEEVSIVVEPADNQPPLKEGELVVKPANDGAMLAEGPLIMESASDGTRLGEGPLDVEPAGDDVSLASHVGLPSMHVGSGVEFQTDSESLGNHVELPEDLVPCDSSNGMVTKGYVAPDDIVAADSLAKSVKQNGYVVITVSLFS